MSYVTGKDGKEKRFFKTGLVSYVTGKKDKEKRFFKTGLVSHATGTYRSLNEPHTHTFIELKTSSHWWRGVNKFPLLCQMISTKEKTNGTSSQGGFQEVKF